MKFWGQQKRISHLPNDFDELNVSFAPVQLSYILKLI